MIQNFFHTSKSVNSLNRLVKCDMKYFNNWLSVKKNPLYIEKTEQVVFKTLRKVLSNKMKIKLCGKRFYP